MTHRQNVFKKSILSQALDELTSQRLTPVQAYVAVIGCAAAIAATLPPDARRALIEGAEGHMQARADAYAADIRSGKFDKEAAGH